MRTIRFVLQFLIFLAGAVGLAVLILNPRFAWIDIAVFSSFWALLLAFTLLLKGHTERRTKLGHQLNSRPFGLFFLSLGVFTIFYGLSFYMSAKALPDGSGTCRAVCGLILLMVQLFGESVGRFAAFALWTGIGIVSCLIGYQGARRVRG